MGKRIDGVMLVGPVIFVLEFKVGESTFSSAALDQVCDYALDLRNFHESSFNHFIAPILIATEATSRHGLTSACALRKMTNCLLRYPVLFYSSELFLMRSCVSLLTTQT